MHYKITSNYNGICEIASKLALEIFWKTRIKFYGVIWFWFSNKLNVWIKMYFTKDYLLYSNKTTNSSSSYHHLSSSSSSYHHIRLNVCFTRKGFTVFFEWLQKISFRISYYYINPCFPRLSTRPDLSWLTRPGIVFNSHYKSISSILHHFWYDHVLFFDW